MKKDVEKTQPAKIIYEICSATVMSKHLYAKSYKTITFT